MPRTKTGTNSASKPKVAKIDSTVVKPNQSVSAIREQYKLEEERQKKNFASASEDKVMRTIRDVARNASTPSLTSTDKETIKGYLTGNIFSNSSRLIEASKYLYYRSPIYSQLIDKYSSMYCFDCRKIEPNYTFDYLKDNLENTQMKIYYFDELKGFMDIYKNILEKNDLVLVKASHGMEFTKIVDELKEYNI